MEASLQHSGCPSQVAPHRLVRSRAVRFRSVRHTACSDCRSSLHVPAGDRTTMDTGCFNASPTIPSPARSTRTTILSITSISRPPAVTVTRVSERISLMFWFATPHVLREKPEGTRGTRPSVPPPRADGHGSSRGARLVHPTPETSDDSGCSGPVSRPSQAPARGIRTRTPCPLGSRNRTSYPIAAFRASPAEAAQGRAGRLSRRGRVSAEPQLPCAALSPSVSSACPRAWRRRDRVRRR